MPPRTVLLDTSFILALENRDDPLHARAKAIDRQLNSAHGIFLLHWGILLEIGDGYARIGRRAKALRLFEKFENEEGYRVHPIDESLLEAALAMYRAPRQGLGINRLRVICPYATRGRFRSLDRRRPFSPGRVPRPAAGAGIGSLVGVSAAMAGVTLPRPSAPWGT
jgi:predicted nucleic acid-binding protein